MKPDGADTATSGTPLNFWRALPLRLVVAAGSLVVFARLAEEILERQSLAFDSAVRASVHQHATPALTIFMRVISGLGSAEVLLPVVVLILVVMLRRGARQQATLLAVTMTGALVLELTLKLAFRRPRPQPFFGIPSPGSYAFPSGHALVSLCFYTALAWMLTERLTARWSRALLWIVAALLIGLTGFSRIYLGMHYPSDVLGGYAAALVWMASLARLRNWPRRDAAHTNSTTQDADA
jgi:undecaprenyl-diphosphatase